MAKRWDEGMESDFESFSDTSAIARPFDAVDRRLNAIDVRLDVIDNRLDRIDVRLEGIDRRLDAMDKRFDAMDQRFDEMDREMVSREERLRNAFRVESERMLDAFAKLAEGFIATGERLERSIEESRRETRQTLSARGRILKDHTKRIVALERARKKR